MIEKRNKPVYMRQRFLLEFIKQLDGGASATDIQKLVFLYCQMSKDTFYEFIPYKFGPYSFQLAEDIEILRKDGFIEYKNACYSSNNEYQVLPFFSPAKERGDQLIKKVYEAYPYYAINSEILDRLFTKSEIVRFIEERKNLQKKGQILYTIGYEGKSLEAFVNILIKNDIKLLCDVRRNPLSRKFGFSKAKLQHVLETVGIKYIHIPEVGIESEKRVSLNTLRDYDLLFDDYTNNLHSISQFLDHIADFLNDYQRIVLMCFEGDPRICHRHIIKNYLIAKYGIVSDDL